MEANKIETKTLIISLATMVCIEVVTRVVISKGLYNQMIILGVTRLLEIILLMLIVLNLGERPTFHRIGSIQDGSRGEKGTDLVSRFCNGCLFCFCCIVCCRY